MTTAVDPQQIRQTLSHYYSAAEYFRHWSGLVYTDGVKYLADSCGAHWLIDLVASYQPRPEPFQIWRLTMLPEEEGEPMAIVEMGEDTNRDGRLVYWRNERVGDLSHATVGPAIRQMIEYTDFPLSEGITLYYENGVLMLRSER